MKGLGFIGENPDSGPKTSKFDVLKVVCYVVLYKIKAKKSCLLSSGSFSSDRFFDTKTIKIEARNYVIVTSLQW